jgi:hypothetical protein
LAAWSAFLAFLVHLKKIRNAERDASHDRFLDEFDRISHQLNVKVEECDLVRDKLAESERISNERLGRAVIAESKLVALDNAEGRPTILPGTTEGEHKGNGG